MRTICLLERADTPLAETRTRTRTQTSKQLHSMGHDTAGFTNSIKFRSARYGRLHKFHQISDSSVTEQSLYLSTTRHPHNLKCKRSTSGALPLASTFRCEFVVGRTMTLSSCEPLAGAACQEAASGEPSCGRQNNKLMGSISSVPCFCDAESAMETRVRDPETAKVMGLPHGL